MPPDDWSSTNFKIKFVQLDIFSMYKEGNFFHFYHYHLKSRTLYYRQIDNTDLSSTCSS